MKWLTRPWSRVEALRVIFFGLGAAAVVFALGTSLSDLFFDLFRPLHAFFADGWAVAFGIAAAFLGGYKFATAQG
ncbi:hypothetical protein [Bosea vaviloviae]|nr:hypothetical protein [Bosea vaviloviae]